MEDMKSQQYIGKKETFIKIVCGFVILQKYRANYSIGFFVYKSTNFKMGFFRDNFLSTCVVSVK